MEKLLLIDGNSIMNRAFYGIMGNRIMMNKQGEYTNALYGFLSILFKNMEEVSPDYIVVAFDSKTGADSRKEKFDGYKASRHKMPDELREQMPKIKEILDAMKIAHIELPSYEGDDILGTLAKRYESKNLEVWVLSGDRDLLQLVDDNIKVRIPRTRASKTETMIYDVAEIEKEFELKPQQLIELKGLMGDSSDEIPGAKGIGPKTGIKILKEYGTIDNLYKAIDDGTVNVKGKALESLIENRDLVYISKEIGTINTNAVIEEDLEDFRLENWQNDETRDLFERFEFNRYLERFDFEKSIEKEEMQKAQEDKLAKVMNITYIESLKEIESLIKSENELVYYLVKEDIDIKAIKKLKKEKEEKEENQKIETLEQNYKDSIIKKQITGLLIYIKDTVYLMKIANIEDKKEELKSLFENDLNKISYDMSLDYVMLREHGIRINNIYFDIDIASYDIDPSNTKKTLDDNISYYIDLDMNNYKTNEKSQISLFDEEVNLEKEKDKLNAIRVYGIKEVYKKTYAKLKENGLELFNKIEMPLIYVLSDMQYYGMKVSKEELEAFGVKLKERLNLLTDKIYELAGEEFNINSPQQLGNILFEKLGLKATKKTKTGYSTNEEVLQGLINDHEIISYILEYRTLMKLNSNYVEGMIACINEKTNKIHSFFNQTITATGRISSSDPNLQNIPARDELGRQIKKAFVASDGYTFVDADYSQIELRVLAHISQDENMINAFRNNEDIHREVAAKVFNIANEEVTAEQRRSAKAVNFGIVYGISAYGLAKQINKSQREAKEYIDSYLEKFAGVREYMHNKIKECKETGYVDTLFGRRRYVPEITNSNFNIREFGKRVAMNTPIQGTAADIMKIAMNNLYKRIQDENLDARIVLQVHDELIIEVKDDIVDKMKSILVEEMENAVKLDIPLKVEVAVSKDWYGLK